MEKNTASPLSGVVTRPAATDAARPLINAGIGARFKAGLQSALEGAAGRVNLSTSPVKRAPPLLSSEGKDVRLSLDPVAETRPPALPGTKKRPFDSANGDSALLGEDEVLGEMAAGVADTSALDDREEDALLEAGEWVPARLLARVV